MDRIYDFDPAKAITDWSKPLLDGGWARVRRRNICSADHLAAEKYKIDLKAPFEDLPRSSSSICCLYGPPKGEAPRTGFHGILAYLRESWTRRGVDGYREYMMQLHVGDALPGCRGKRLRPESLAVTVPIGGEPCRLRISPRCRWSGRLRRAMRSAASPGASAWLRTDLQREVIERLEFLNAVGLDYLSLDRSCGDAFRRRGPAHSAGNADWLAAARRAVCAG